MVKVIWTQPALLDLNDIAEYIALDDSGAARRLVKKVFCVVDNLEKFPNSGRQPPELKQTQYLEKIVGPCRIFYRIEKQSVYILHVMRGERELRKYLLDERKNERKADTDF